MSEYPVVFPNRDGQRLVGIVHESEEDSTGLGARPIIVFVFGGVMGRVAQVRQYVTLARCLCADGHTILRFDCHNMGDSEGELPRCNTKSYYGTIQTGRYVADVQAGIDFILGRYGARPVILVALCGGAITALLTAAADRRISRLALLSIPVAIDDETVDYSRRGGLYNYVENLYPYFLKLTKPGYWKRFLTGQSEYRFIWDSLKGLVLSGAERAKRRFYPSRGKELQSVTPGGAKINPRFFSAFETCMLTDRKILFVFGGNDSFYHEFKDFFETKFAPKHREYESNYSVEVLPLANHMFAFPSWQNDMQKLVRNWIAQQFR